MFWQSTPFTLPLIIGAIISAILAYTTWRLRPSLAAGPLTLFLAAISLWSFTYATELSSINLTVKIFLAKIQYIGIVTIPIAMLAFTFEYSQQKEWLTLRKIGLWSIFPACVLIAVWTNEYHNLIWAQLILDSSRSFTVMDAQYGPLFWIWSLYAYILIAVSTVAIVRLAIRSPQLSSTQAGLLLSGFFIPWASNALSISSFDPFPGLDLTPFALLATAVASSWSIFRFQLWDVLPVVRNVVFESMRDGVIVLDTQNQVISLNRTAQEMLNCTMPDVVSRPVTKIFHEWQEIQDELAGRSEGTVEIIVGQAERALFLEVQILPCHDRRKRLIGQLVTIRNITERRRTELRLREAQKLESIGVLAGGVAHDFNNLLVAMQGQSSLALMKLEPDSPSRKHIEKAISATERAVDLTRQMLVYSGRSHLEIQSVDLNEVIQQNVNLFTVSIPKNVKLELDLTEPLPHINADVGQIQQVVMNLILNAAEASGGNPETIRIVTATQHVAHLDNSYMQFTGKPLIPGNYVKLEVQDNGLGMDTATLSKIFDPFFTTKLSGRGLGLASVLGIVRGHKGGLSAESTVGKGTTFKLLFPVHKIRNSQ